MKSIDVTIVRIYILEAEHQLQTIINYLRNEAKIRGISVFRAISGFGETGNHTASMVDLSLNLPLTIEFFDSKEKINQVLDHFSQTIKHEHIVYWDVKTNA